MAGSVCPEARQWRGRYVLRGPSLGTLPVVNLEAGFVAVAYRVPQAATESDCETLTCPFETCAILDESSKMDKLIPLAPKWRNSCAELGPRPIQPWAASG